jgi:hypothetical protein
MADYFAALAARTLRPEASVQPRRRVFWEEAAEPMAVPFPATKKKIADGARPNVSDEGKPPRRSRRTSTAEPSPPESEPVARRPGQKRGKRKGASDQEDTHAMASTPHPTVRALEPTVKVRFERVAAGRGDAPGKRPVVASERAEATARASDIERAHRLPTRLSARERESTAEPAIRIHIGRVDVRAVTTAVPGSPPPASRGHTRALMSLDEYVQKRDRGVS